MNYRNLLQVLMLSINYIKLSIESKEMFLKPQKCFTLFRWNFSEIQLSYEVLK